MTTTVSLKPNATKLGEADYAKTGAANAYTALSDNSDSSYVQRSSTSNPASLRLALDLSVIPGGKTLNRWRIRVRNDRDTSKAKWHARVEWLEANGSTFTLWGAQVSRSGVLAGPAWDDGGWFGANLNDFLTGYSPYIPGVGIVDDATASGDRSKLYELWVECEYLDPPSVSVTAPTGTVTDTNYPTVIWGFTSTEGNPQARVRVKVFDSATYSTAGFDPETFTPVWDSGVGYGASLSWQVDSPLASGTYRAYVLASEDTGWALNTSAWAYSQFTISIAPPAVPSVVAGYDQDTNSVAVTAQGHTNLLTAEQANLEGGTTTGWAAVTNCSITNSTTVGGKVGSRALRLSSTAGGDMMANTATGTGGVPVVAGETYSGLADFRAGASARSVKVALAWYDGTGAFLSETAGSPVSDGTGSWTFPASVVGVAPATAAYAALRVYVLATGGASELHYVDCAAIYPGVAAASVNLCVNPSAEVNVDGFVPFFSSVTISRSTVRATHGTASFLATATAAGNQPSGFSQTGLTPGAWYTIAADVYIDSADGTTQVELGTLDAAVNDSAVTTVKDGWVRLVITIQAAATSHFIFVGGTFLASGNKFYADSIQVEAGTSSTAFSLPGTAWSVGGFSGHSLRLERSNDGGVTWAQVRRATSDVGLNDGVGVTVGVQRYAVTDYEAARPGVVLYRVRQTATLSGVTASSDWTTNYQLTTTSDGQAWLKAVAAPSLNAKVRLRRGSFDAQVEEDTAVFRPLGRAGRAVVVSGDLGGLDGQITVLTTSPAEYETAYDLLTHQGVLLVQDVKVDADGRGLQRWVRCVGTRDIARADNPAIEDLTVRFVYVGPD